MHTYADLERFKAVKVNCEATAWVITDIVENGNGTSRMGSRGKLRKLGTMGGP